VKLASRVSQERFAELYEMSTEALGAGMSGKVMLARVKQPLAYRRANTGRSCGTGRSSPPASLRGSRSASLEFDDTDADRDTWQEAQELLEDAREETPIEDFVAIKTLEKRGLSKGQLKRVLAEVQIYLKMDHEHIAKLLRVCDEPDKIYLVMEYCSGGALCDRLLETGHYTDDVAKDVLRQVLSAVNYCHCHPKGKVVHFDLKHSNFVYASKSPGAALKLVDFGLSRILSNNRPAISSFSGTLYYMAPEVIRRDACNELCDMWSVGVIAYSLLCGTPPFHGRTEEQTAKAILKGEMAPMRGQVWSGVGDDAKAFVRQLLQVDPSNRPTAEVALQHPWLKATKSTDVTKAPVELSRDVLERVRKFAHENELRRAVAALVVYSHGVPTGEDVDLLEAQFRALDVDGNGTISASELVQALHETLGIPREQGQWIFGRLDVDSDTQIHHTEFLAAAMGATLLRYKDTITEAFKQFDENQDGKIELGELKNVLGESFCGKPTETIFEELDTNGDHSIDINEFSAMVAYQLSSPDVAPEEDDGSPSAHSAEESSSGSWSTAASTLSPAAKSASAVEGMRAEWERRRLIQAKQLLAMLSRRHEITTMDAQPGCFRTTSLPARATSDWLADDWSDGFGGERGISERTGFEIPTTSGPKYRQMRPCQDSPEDQWRSRRLSNTS